MACISRRPLLTIQIVTRWSSDVILRYVAEAPLTALTSMYRRAADSIDLDSALSELLVEKAETKSIVEGLDAKTRAMIEEELGKRKAQDMASFDFVQREGDHVGHYIRTCPLLAVSQRDG